VIQETLQLLAVRPGAGDERGEDETVGVAETTTRVRLIIDEEMCKGCGLCVSVCPRRAMGLANHINSRGFHPAAPLYLDKCTACAQCALMCPEVCITILKYE